MGHADLIDIRETHRVADPDGVRVLDDRIRFSADIARRLLYLLKNIVIECQTVHIFPPVWRPPTPSHGELPPREGVRSIRRMSRRSPVSLSQRRASSSVISSQVTPRSAIRTIRW